MSEIIIPGKSGVVHAIDPSTGVEWEAGEKTLPGGYRMVGSVSRPDGDVYDLGQNSEGKFALFKRRTDPYEFWSHGPAERLSDADIAGFGILRFACAEPGDMEEHGDYSSLARSNLITPNLGA